MQRKYRLFQRAQGVYYWQDNETKQQGSLRTKDPLEAEKLLNAKNEAHREPRLNLALGRAYLSAHDPEAPTRDWQRVMNEMAKNGKETTQERCARAFRSKAFDPIRSKPLIQTTAEDLLLVIRANGNATAHYLRRLHNLALNFGWLAWPVLQKALWPKIVTGTKRAISAGEHERIIAAEKNVERKKFYQVLYETGAAQTDGASLRGEDVDWKTGVLSYRRRKLSTQSEPAHLSMGPKLRAILETLPRNGLFFPVIFKESAKHRAAEFRRRCNIVKVEGVSLHSYRHSWAERAKSCGYPQRFAQVALGHSSRAVHEAYAKSALVICPPLDEFEAGWTPAIRVGKE